MHTVFVISGTMLLVAATITMYRVLAGPGTLDRLVGVDTLVALTMGGLAIWAAYSRDTALIPAIVALSLVGFVGSAAVARFRVRDDTTGPHDGRSSR